MTAARDIGVLAVGTALVRGRVSEAELAAKYGFDRQLIADRLGLVQKCVATGEDEHPSDLGTRAARRALDALGAKSDDVGMILYVGTSRDRMGSWCGAIEIARRLEARRGLAYDVAAGCAAAVVALHTAATRADRSPPLTLIVAAERWTQTLNPSGGFPITWLAHADGASACVVGPGASFRLGPAAFELAPEFNDYVLIPAGGSKEPITAQAVAEGRQYRMLFDSGPTPLLDSYVRGYTNAITTALAHVDARAGDIQLLVMNQVQPVRAAQIRASLGLADDRTIQTYRTLGHLGTADVFLGLDVAARQGRLRSGVTVLAASSTTTFGAMTLVGANGAEVATSRDHDLGELIGVVT